MEEHEREDEVLRCFIWVPREKDYGAGMWCRAPSFRVWSHCCQQRSAAQKQRGLKLALTASLPLCSPSFSSSLYLSTSHLLSLPSLILFFFPCQPFYLALHHSYFFSSCSSRRQLNTKCTHIYAAPVLITRQYLLSYGLTGSGFNAGIASCQSMLFYSD